MSQVPVLLLSVSRWNFNDERTGENRKGSTAHVVHLDSLSDENNVGGKPVKYSLPYDFFEKYKNEKLPAYANMEFVFDFTRQKAVPKDFVELTAL